MSGIDNIIAKIKEKNEARIAQLDAETQAKIAEIKKASELQLQTDIENLEKANKEAISNIKSNATVSAASNCRKDQLVIKSAMLKQAFNGALDKMRAFDADAKKNYAKALVLKLATGCEEFIASDSVYDSTFISELNSALVAAGKEGNVTLVNSNKKLDGFILRKGGMSYNLTYESVIKDIKESIDIDVAKILFEA